MSAPVTEQAAALTVEATSRALRLPTVREQAGSLAEAALRDRLSHLAYLAELLQAELDDRDARRRERRVHEARFPRLKHLADFDLAAAPSVDPAMLASLESCEWVERGEPVVLLGDSGTGKSHLLIGLGMAACQRGLRVRYTTAAQLVNELAEAADERMLTRVVAEGVTETVVTAEAVQRGTDVDIDPPDADEEADGHQVALQDLAEITVTVTSADGSREKVYRVQLGDPTPESWAHCLRGDIAEGFSLLVYEGGSVEDLVACAESRGVTVLYALHEGVYIPYIPVAPEFVNERFAELFPDGLPPFTPLVAGSNGPPSTDPNRGDGAPLPGLKCLRGEIAEGFSLLVSEGGSVDELVACAESLHITALYDLQDGEWVSYILGAPQWVNEGFAELFPDGISPITPLVAKGPVPTVDASQAGAASR